MTTADLYDPTKGTAGEFGSVGSMKAARHEHAAVLLKTGNVLITGGTGASSAELFTYGGSGYTGLFSLTDSMATARLMHRMTLLEDGNVLVTGGGVGAEVYDVNAGTFAAPIPMQETRWGHSVTKLANGALIVVGGHVSLQTSVATTSTEFYCP